MCEMVGQEVEIQRAAPHGHAVDVTATRALRVSIHIQEGTGGSCSGVIGDMMD